MIVALIAVAGVAVMGWWAAIRNHQKAQTAYMSGFAEGVKYLYRAAEEGNLPGEHSLIRVTPPRFDWIE